MISDSLNDMYAANCTEIYNWIAKVTYENQDLWERLRIC